MSQEEIQIDPSIVIVLSCPLCPFVTLHLTKLSDHAAMHKEFDITYNIYQCSHCKLASSSSDLLTEHSELHHPDHEVDLSVLEEIYLNSTAVDDSDDGNCEADSERDVDVLSVDASSTGVLDFSEDAPFQRGFTTNKSMRPTEPATSLKSETFSSFSFTSVSKEPTEDSRRSWQNERNNRTMKRKSPGDMGAGGSSLPVGMVGPGLQRGGGSGWIRGGRGTGPSLGAMSGTHTSWPSKRMRTKKTVSRSPGGGGSGSFDKSLGRPDLVISQTGQFILSHHMKDKCPASLQLEPGFYPEQTANELLNALVVDLPWRQLSSVGKSGQTFEEPRMTHWTGPKYSYGRIHLNGNNSWHPTLERIRNDIQRHTGQQFNACLAILYRSQQDTMQWHADDEPEMGPRPEMVSVSFGNMRLFELKRKRPAHGQGGNQFHYVQVPLHNGSLLWTGGSLQQDWLHRVPRSSAPCGARVNLTFRQLRTK